MRRSSLFLLPFLILDSPFLLHQATSGGLVQAAPVVTVMTTVPEYVTVTADQAANANTDGSAQPSSAHKKCHPKKTGVASDTAQSSAATGALSITLQNNGVVNPPTTDEVKDTSVAIPSASAATAESSAPPAAADTYSPAPPAAAETSSLAPPAPAAAETSSSAAPADSSAPPAAAPSSDTAASPAAAPSSDTAAAAPPSSSAAAPAAESSAATPAPATPAKVKRAGVAWGQCSLGITSMDAWNDGRWYYNWDSKPTSMAPSNMEFIPMIFGKDSHDTFLKDTKDLKFDYVLGYNEPNLVGFDAKDAATQWGTTIKAMRDAHPGQTIKLVSPAMSNDDTKWLPEFWSLADPKPDVLALHWYGTEFSDLQNYIESMRKQFPTSEVWVTEVAIYDYSPAHRKITADEPGPFLKTLSDYAETNKDWLTRWAFFGFSNNFSDDAQPPMSPFNQLYETGTNTISALGKQYQAYN